MFAFNRPYNKNKAIFIIKLNKSLSSITKKYDNIILIEDLNIDFNNLKKLDTHSHLSDLCDTFSLSNLVNGFTCVISQNSISIVIQSKKC